MHTFGHFCLLFLFFVAKIVKKSLNSGLDVTIKVILRVNNINN